MQARLLLLSAATPEHLLNMLLAVLCCRLEIVQPLAQRFHLGVDVFHLSTQLVLQGRDRQRNEPEKGKISVSE